MSLTQHLSADYIVYSPGRINLIGEHTDYNDGWVLPSAINKEIKLYFKENSHPSICSVYSQSLNKKFSFDLTNIQKSTVEWENYVLGVIDQLQKNGFNLKGFDVSIESDLPSGSGISSSAALECGIGMGLNEMFQLHIPREDIVKMAQKAEQTFVGTQCGVMDQYASVMSKDNTFILLDCRSLAATYIPVDLDNYNLVLLNTKVSHSLASSEYNTRRAECEKVVTTLRKKYDDVNALRDVTLPMLNEFKEYLTPTLFKRAKFVISENSRVLKAAETLHQKDFYALGNLMYESHNGLQHDYEVSCKELDFLVDFSRYNKAVLGSRMMGGGFGGCTISLVEKGISSFFIDQAYNAYKKEFNLKLDSMIVQPTSGTRIQKLNS
ncbi:galactokinase [Gangjinia marincola]|uniref:Galactokinase n=1 Tax=Gangjinia marincola TaxID=578463 RepID=A0ABN1MKA5_9FLAO